MRLMHRTLFRKISQVYLFLLVCDMSRRQTQYADNYLLIRTGYCEQICDISYRRKQAND